MKIISYKEKYRDDMIFMVLEAKNALGRIPHINGDLLDIQKYYLDVGDMFYIVLDENDRVIGCGGYNSMEVSGNAKLHRIYIKYTLKRRGIGSMLLQSIENAAKERGIKTMHVHLGGKEYFESHSFYPKHGYVEYAPFWMKKEL